jgi:putative oxidoreductase
MIGQNPPDAVRRICSTRVRGRAGVATAALRIVAGILFVLASLPKFLLHDMELSEFVRYGLPASDLLVYLVGLLELGGGALLVLGLATRVAALALALNMVGAVLTAGVRVGGWFHLGVAPTLLLAMVYLLWAGSGAKALDRRLASPARRPVDLESGP